MVLMKMLFIFASTGCALTNSDGEESSMLQLQRRSLADADEDVDCASGKCKPPKKTTTTLPYTTTTQGYTTTTQGYTTTTQGYTSTTTTSTTTTTTTTTTSTTTSTTTTTTMTTLRTSTTTPTTTSTTTLYVNPDAKCEGVSCETICSGPVLHFEGRNIVENTLAGSGYSGGGRMKIIDVADGIDLYISDASSAAQREHRFDMSAASANNGYRAGSWMSGKTGIYTKDGEEKEALRIAMERTGSYKFKFELKNKAGEPVALEEFPLVFYDMDYYESVESCDASGTVVSENTDLRVRSYNGCTTFEAGYNNAESPDDFDQPTPEQAKASAAFVYTDKSEWTMTFSLSRYSHRWVLFKSSKGLSCATTGTPTVAGPSWKQGAGDPEDGWCVDERTVAVNVDKQKLGEWGRKYSGQECLDLCATDEAIFACEYQSPFGQGQCWGYGKVGAAKIADSSAASEKAADRWVPPVDTGFFCAVKVAA